MEMAELREALSSQHPAPSALALESQVEALELDILRFELELEERGTTSLLDKLMGVAEPAVAVKPEPLAVGVLIDDRYKVDRLMSKSERGAVYGVSDQNTPQQWVVKEVWGDQGPLSSEQVDRWTLEARRLWGMRHPNLPRVVDAMSEQGRCFLVVDALTGVRLGEVLSATGSMPAERGLPICLQLAEVVRYLHQQSPPFRISDLSSRRILVEASGQIKVTSSDFAHRIDTLKADSSAGLEQDVCDLAKLVFEVLGESEVLPVSEPLNRLLLGGLEGPSVDLDILVQLLADEIRSLRKEESGVTTAIVPEQREAKPEPSSEDTTVRARSSSRPTFPRGGAFICTVRGA